MSSVFYVREGRGIRWPGEPTRSEAPSGHVPAALAAILALPTLLDHPTIRDSARSLGFDRERSLFHSARSGIRILVADGFLVWDLITAGHPEWVTPSAATEGGG